MLNQQASLGQLLTPKTDPLNCYIMILREAICTSGTSEETSNQLLGYLRARDFRALLNWSVRPSPQMYETATSYYVEAQLAALIRKYPFGKSEVPGIDPGGAALKKFLSSEHRCRWVNRRRRAKRKRFDRYAQCMMDLRRYIERVIGVTPDWPSICAKCDFTGGASLGVHGNKTSIARKLYAQHWTVTPVALPYVIPALWNNIQIRDCILPGVIKCYDPREFADRVRAKVQSVCYNKVTFVPKNALTHRAIACEPLLNGFLQKGIEEEMKARLRRAGIDLSSQTTNQALARLGTVEKFNPYVTIDLSAASDSLALEVVKDLLPPDWFELLDAARSPCYKDRNNSIVRYEKFCSMGNGTCFPLETLIFAGVAFAAARYCGSDDTDFSVYGDDIIVRQNTALVVLELLRELGFTANVQKTFITGPFRESCGSDWFDGQDVRPVHLDKQLVDVRQLFALHNSTLRSRRTELFFETVRPLIRSLGGTTFLRPGRESGDTCYSVPLDVAMASSRVSWGGTIFVDQPLRRKEKVNFRWVWHEILSLPKPDTGRLCEVAHANALMLAVMRGASSHMPFAIRYESEPKRVAVSRPWQEDYNSDFPPWLSLPHGIAWTVPKVSEYVAAGNRGDVHLP